MIFWTEVFLVDLHFVLNLSGHVFVDLQVTRYFSMQFPFANYMSADSHSNFEIFEFGY